MYELASSGNPSNPSKLAGGSLVDTTGATESAPIATATKNTAQTVINDCNCGLHTLRGNAATVVAVNNAHVAILSSTLPLAGSSNSAANHACFTLASILCNGDVGELTNDPIGTAGSSKNFVSARCAAGGFRSRRRAPSFAPAPHVTSRANARASFDAARASPRAVLAPRARRPRARTSTSTSARASPSRRARAAARAPRAARRRPRAVAGVRAVARAVAVAARVVVAIASSCAALVVASSRRDAARAPRRRARRRGCPATTATTRAA